MTRNYAEEDSVKKGIASFAVASGASVGDVAQIDTDGSLTLAAAPGGFQPDFYGAVLISASSPSSDGTYTERHLEATEGFAPCVAVNVLQTITAGEGNGFLAQITAPEFGGGTCVVTNAQIQMVNAAGTQKLVLNAPAQITLTTGEHITDLDFRTWTETERIGADLTVNATDGSTIDSTAGGQFMGQFNADFQTSALTT